MNKKRIALIVLAMMLVCVLSIAGTMAYLQATTTVVTNTFIAAGGTGPFVDTEETTGTDENGEEVDETKSLFELLENEVTQDESGKYVQSEEEVKGNTYEVMPGTTIPKKAFVKLSRTGYKYKYNVVNGVRDEGTKEQVSSATPAPAYLFIEVVSGLNNAYGWSIDSANWTELTGAEPVNTNAKVYVYTGAAGADGAAVSAVENAKKAKVLTTVENGTKFDILTEDKITVATEATAAQLGGTTGIKLEFYAYLSQASVNGVDDPTTVFNTCF